MALSRSKLTDLGAVEVAERLAAGRISHKRYVEDLLRRWDAVKFSRSLAHLDIDAVEEAATARDGGAVEPGKLAGVPFVVSNNVNVAGWSTNCGNEALKAHTATHDAAAVRSLRAAGAVVFAHSTTGELGLSATGGSVVNPHSASSVAGGPCGGAAAAVASRVVPFAVATDTMGCARVPASFCGVAAFRPTPGRYPSSDALIASHTKGSLAVIARDVADLQALDRVLKEEPPPAGPTEEEQAHAAVKIQAVARGRRDRLRVAALRTEAGGAAAGAGSADGDDDREAAAAVKIQAIARGRRDRAVMMEKRAALEEERAAVRIQAVARGRAARKTVRGGGTATDSKLSDEAEAEAEESKFRDEEEAAATRIAAAARGRRDRARVAQLRASREEEAAAVRIQAIARGRRDRMRVSMLRDVMAPGGFANLKGLRLGVLRPLMEDVDHAVAAVVDKALTRLQAAGVELVDISVPSADFLDSVDITSNTVQGFEAPRQLDVAASVAGPEGKALRASLTAAGAVPPAAYHEALLELRPRLQRTVENLFADHGVVAVVYPSVPVPARRPVAGCVDLCGRDVHASATFTRNANFAATLGLPSVTVPAGVTAPPMASTGRSLIPPSPRVPGQPVPSKAAGGAAERLPVGLELSALPTHDEVLLAIAKSFQHLQPRIADPIATARWRTSVTKV